MSLEALVFLAVAGCDYIQGRLYVCGLAELVGVDARSICRSNARVLKHFSGNTSFKTPVCELIGYGAELGLPEDVVIAYHHLRGNSGREADKNVLRGYLLL